MPHTFTTYGYIAVAYADSDEAQIIRALFTNIEAAKKECQAIAENYITAIVSPFTPESLPTIKIEWDTNPDHSIVGDYVDTVGEHDFSLLFRILPLMEKKA